MAHSYYEESFKLHSENARLRKRIESLEQGLEIDKPNQPLSSSVQTKMKCSISSVTTKGSLDSKVDGYNLHKRLGEYRDNHLLFLRHPEIEYTDNISERALQKYKRKQKKAVTFR